MFRFSQAYGSLPPRPVVIVTGGSSGIGAACVRRFLDQGWEVALAALPDKHLAAWQPRDTLLKLGGDLTSRKFREHVVTATLERFGRIDILVNNAGVGLYAMPSQASVELSRRMFDLNVFAPLAMAQLIIPYMRRQGQGTIVNIGSIGGEVALPWAALYSASKFALHGIDAALRVELRRDRIHVLRVCPGIVDTPFRSHVLGGEAPPAVSNIRRIISPETVAEAILNGIRRRRRIVYVPFLSWAFVTLGRLLPGVMDWYLESLIARHSPSSNSAPCSNASGEDDTGR